MAKKKLKSPKPFAKFKRAKRQAAFPEFVTPAVTAILGVALLSTVANVVNQ